MIVLEHLLKFVWRKQNKRELSLYTLILNCGFKFNQPLNTGVGYKSIFIKNAKNYSI